MTADDAKKLTLWMQSHGVVQFAFDGLQVAFHARSVKVKEQNSGAKGAAPYRGNVQSQTMTEYLFPDIGAPDAESYKV